MESVINGGKPLGTKAENLGSLCTELVNTLYFQLKSGNAPNSISLFSKVIELLKFATILGVISDDPLLSPTAWQTK